jgi:DNA repair photolyase
LTYERAFATLEQMAPTAALRWTLAGDEPQAALFDDGLPSGARDLPGVEYMHVRARTIISTVPPQSRMPFRHTINAYRGCTHACVYCFARPTHRYLDLDTGADFERKIVVKVNAVERLRAELRSPKWTGEHIAMGTNTDPYQPAEGRYRLTRGLIRVLSEARNPFSILTKSTMILRDMDLLVEAAKRTTIGVSFSIGTLDERVWRSSEPGTPPPRQRVEALRRLVDAGIECGVLVAPILPGLSDRDDQLSAVVRAVIDAGAVSISSIGLHLRPGVRELFMPWLARTRPDLVARYEELYGARNGYLARSEAEQLGERVRALIARHGGCSRSPRLARGAITEVPARPAAAAESFTQLRLVG